MGCQGLTFFLSSFPADQETHKSLGEFKKSAEIGHGSSTPRERLRGNTARDNRAESLREESLPPRVSGLQKGPAERGHIKKRQKSSKCVKNVFRHFSRRAKKTSKIVQKCQKVFRHFSTNFARHQFSGPSFLGGSERGSPRGTPKTSERYTGNDGKVTK